MSGTWWWCTEHNRPTSKASCTHDDCTCVGPFATVLEAMDWNRSVRTDEEVAPVTYQYKATAINVVDGDTLDVYVDLGFRITLEQRVRLYGINTPERGQPGAIEAALALVALVWPNQDHNNPLTVNTVKPRDKYGRWLARIATPTCPDVAQALIDAGHGVAYDGGAR